MHTYEHTYIRTYIHTELIIAGFEGAHAESVGVRANSHPAVVILNNEVVVLLVGFGNRRGRV
jgi:hypothetical protein